MLSDVFGNQLFIFFGNLVALRQHMAYIRGIGSHFIQEIDGGLGHASILDIRHKEVGCGLPDILQKGFVMGFHAGIKAWHVYQNIIRQFF